MIDAISLDAHWRCEYFEDDPDEVEFATGFDIPTLAGWVFDPLRMDGWAAWLEKNASTCRCKTSASTTTSASTLRRPEPDFYINGRDFGRDRNAAPFRR